MEMELVSGSHIPDGLLAAITLLSEKPRQGVPSWNPAPIQGISEANCTALLGLRLGCSGIVSGTVVATNTEVFSYDYLNRINCSLRSDNAFHYTYTSDSFGNLTAHDQVQGDLGDNIDPATNRLFFHGGYVSYDGAGEITGIANVANSSTIPVTYTGEQRVRCVGSSCQLGSYEYDAVGQRQFAQHSQAWNEYVYLDGQPMADVDNAGTWTDYIYANGQKIGKVASQSPAIHVHGNDCSGCNSGWVNSYISSPIVGYSIQNGAFIDLTNQVYCRRMVVQFDPLESRVRRHDTGFTRTP